MWIYEKSLQHPVKIANPNPRLAGIIITALGGPDGELGAAMRYLNQRYTMPDGRVIGMITDSNLLDSSISTMSATAFSDVEKAQPVSVNTLLK